MGVLSRYLIGTMGKMKVTDSMISGVAADFRTRNLENTSLVHTARHPACCLSVCWGGEVS